MDIFVIGFITLFCILLIISLFFIVNAKVFPWLVYCKQSTYRIARLDSMHEVTYIGKWHKVGGSIFETSSKEEACEIACRLNTIERMEIANAKANEWKQVNC